LLLCCCSSSDNSSNGDAKDPSGPDAVRRQVLPALYGISTSMAGVVFATGAAMNNMWWIAAGAALLVVAVVCTWDWLWRQELSLGAWAPASIAFATLCRVMQGHFLFRDFRWDPTHMSGILIVWKWPGLPLFLCGIFLLVVVASLFLASSDSEALLCSDRIGKLNQTAQLLSRAQSIDEPIRDPEVILEPLPLVAWALFPVCICTLLLGISLPYLETDEMAPDLTYVQYEGGWNTTAPGSAHQSKTLRSYVDFISYLYDRRLPCSALAVAYSSCIAPPIQFACILVALIRPSWVPLYLQRLMQNELSSQATLRFGNPMVMMLLVALLNFTGPGAKYFQTSFCPGFWFYNAYCLVSLFLSLMLDVDADRPSKKRSQGKDPLCGRSCLSPSSHREFRSSKRDPAAKMQRRTRSKGSSNSLRSVSDSEAGWSDEEEDNSDEEGSGSDSSESGDIPWPMVTTFIAGGTLLIAVGSAAMYVALTEPFLDFEYRISGVVVDTTSPTMLELWANILETNLWLGRLAAITLVYVMFLWMPLLAVSIFATRRGPACAFSPAAWNMRWTEKLVRPWAMAHIWAMSVVCVLYMTKSRNRMIFEVCAHFPARPDGFIAIVVMGVCVYLLHAIAKPLCSNPERELSYYWSGAPSLPGGSCVWGLGPGITFFFIFVSFYLHGPTSPPPVQDLKDVNSVLQRFTIPANEELKKLLPFAAGHCEDLWQWQSSPGQVPVYHGGQAAWKSDCLGHHNLAETTEDSSMGGKMNIKARWATGLDTLELTSLKVVPPTNIINDVQKWTFEIGALFTNLHVYIKVLLGDEVFIPTAPMCCNNPFHFTLQLTAYCEVGAGFGHVNLEVRDMDKIEFVHNVQGRSESPGEATSYQVNYGRSDVVEKALKKFMSLKMGKIIISHRDGSTEDPLENMGSVLDHIVQLNTGHHCLRSF
jgi:hypothetical protein